MRKNQLMSYTCTYVFWLKFDFVMINLIVKDILSKVKQYVI